MPTRLGSPRVRRVAASLTALSAVGALVSGCGAGPSQVGSAAIVGSSSIPLAEIQQRIDDVLARQDLLRQPVHADATPADLARTVLTNEIQHRLLDEAARRERIVIGDQEIDAELKRPLAEQRRIRKLVLTPEQARDAARDDLIARAITAKYLNRLTVTVDLLFEDSRDEALATARKLAAGPRQAAEVLAQKTAQPGLVLRPALLPQGATQALFGIPAGQVVALWNPPSLMGPEEWPVVRVTRRDTNGRPPADPNQSALAQLDVDTMAMIGRRFTQPLAEELGVRANPRYGNWDPAFLAVIPPEQPQTVVLPARLN